MKRINPSKPRVRRTLYYRMIILSALLIFAVMGGLTWAVAADMDLQMEHELSFYVSNMRTRERRDDTSLPGTLEINMIEQLGSSYHFIQLDSLLPIVDDQMLLNPIDSDDWLWGKWDLFYGFEPAVIYYSDNGTPLIRTGDYLTFSYTTEDRWFSRDVTALGQSFLALDEIPGGTDAFAHLLGNHPTGSLGMTHYLPVLRLTGYFENQKFIPTTIDRGDYVDSYGRETDIKKLCQLDGKHSVEWENILNLEGEKSTTIYAWELGGFNTTHRPVDTIQKSFPSLTALLHETTYDTVPGHESLVDSIRIARKNHTDAFGEYQIAAAVRYSPLLYAVLRMWKFYLLVILISACILIPMFRSIRLNLVEPLENMAYAEKNGTHLLPRSEWDEPSHAEQYFIESSKISTVQKQEIQQLRTALEYAQNAEQRRKKLISDITHELKTPLAIIRSYAECLQEDVAPEKRGLYLDTIQEEIVQIDGMVMQMLELSRLDAGKVRLSKDRFSLLDLTDALLEKFDPMLRARKLSVHKALAYDFLLSADQRRIEQVITNLLSNAVKYSSEGGDLHIQIFTGDGKAFFFLENTAPHLNEDALQNVFDSFYRADTARNTPGTGLGLALVKSIISLHGGTVSVSNTFLENGACAVRFGFTVPLI